MDKTITELQTKLEELKKRLKSISTAQSNQTALVSIKNYFSTIQEYLNIINNNYSGHIEECSSHTTSISDLQNQINEINLKIENLPTGESDTTELQNSIANLENSLLELQSNFDELTANSDTTISQIVNNISDLQTEVGIINDYISTHEQDFSATSTKLNSLETNVDNLTTAQSGLQSTQNTLTNNLNNVENRLTTAEANINALTGGVDVSGLDNRISELENVPPTVNLVEHVYIPVNQTFDTVSQRIIKYVMFSCNNYGKGFIRYKVKFTPLSIYGSTFQFYTDTKLLKQLSFAGNKDESTEIEYSDFFEYYSSIIPVSISVHSSSGVFIEAITIDVFANNINQINYDQEYKVYCFNNEIYLTRKTDTSYQFGKFTMDNLSLTEFPYELSYDNQIINDKNINAIRLIYTPISTGTNGTFEGAYDSIALHTSNKFFQRFINIDSTMENLTKNKSTIASQFYYDFVPTTMNNFCILYINNGQPTFYQPFDNQQNIKFSNLSKYKSGEWSYVTSVVNNNLTLESNYVLDSGLMAVALNEDGYFYLLPQKSLSYVVKIARGKSATAYLQTDGSINVYIKKDKYIYKYNLKKDDNNKYVSSYIKRYEADIIYEILNGYRIRNTADYWGIEANT